MHIDEIEATLRIYKISKTIKNIDAKRFKNRSAKRLASTTLKITETFLTQFMLSDNLIDETIIDKLNRQLQSAIKKNL